MFKFAFKNGFFEQVVDGNLPIWITWRKFSIWHFRSLFLKTDLKKLAVSSCATTLMLFWRTLTSVEDKACRCRISPLTWTGTLRKKIQLRAPHFVLTTVRKQRCRPWWFNLIRIREDRSVIHGLFLKTQLPLYRPKFKICKNSWIDRKWKNKYLNSLTFPLVQLFFPNYT